jgi:thioredoxin 1
MSKVIKTNEENFEADVLKSGKNVMVDFWAEWCGPCRALAPILDEVSLGLAEDCVILKVNVDENPELARKYGVRGIPTMIVFKKGIATKTLVGVQGKDAIKAALSE